MTPEPGEAKSRIASLRRAAGVFKYLAPYRVRFAGAICALLVSTGVGLSFPYLTGLLLDAASGRGAAPGWASSINSLALILLGTLAAQAFFSFFATYWFYGCGESATVSELMRAADRRLYEAKHRGRNLSILDRDDREAA